MGTFSDDAKNYMLDQRLGTGATSGSYGALCNGAPTGAADALTKEISGGTPAYARKQANFNAASSGSKTLAANSVYDIPAGGAFSHVAWWRVASSGTAADYIGSTALAAAESAYGSQGTYTLTAQSFTITD